MSIVRAGVHSTLVLLTCISMTGCLPTQVGVNVDSSGQMGPAHITTVQKKSNGDLGSTQKIKRGLSSDKTATLTKTCKVQDKTSTVVTSCTLPLNSLLKVLHGKNVELALPKVRQADGGLEFDWAFSTAWSKQRSSLLGVKGSAIIYFTFPSPITSVSGQGVRAAGQAGNVLIVDLGKVKAGTHVKATMRGLPAVKPAVPTPGSTEARPQLLIYGAAGAAVLMILAGGTMLLRRRASRRRPTGQSTYAPSYITSAYTGEAFPFGPTLPTGPNLTPGQEWVDANTSAAFPAGPDNGLTPPAPSPGWDNGQTTPGAPGGSQHLDVPPPAVPDGWLAPGQ